MITPGNLVGGGGMAVNGIKETYNIAAGQSIKRGDPIKMVTGVNGGAPFMTRTDSFAKNNGYPQHLTIFKNGTRAFALDSDRLSGKRMILHLFGISATGEMNLISSTVVDYTQNYTTSCVASKFVCISEFEENNFIIIWYSEAYTTSASHFVLCTTLDLTTDTPSRILQTAAVSNSSGTSADVGVTGQTYGSTFDIGNSIKLSNTEFVIMWSQGAISGSTEVLYLTAVRFSSGTFYFNTITIDSLPNYSTQGFYPGSLIHIESLRIAFQYVIYDNGIYSLRTKKATLTMSSSGNPNISIAFNASYNFSHTFTSGVWYTPYFCCMKNSSGQHRFYSVFRHNKDDSSVVDTIIRLNDDTWANGAEADLNNNLTPYVTGLNTTNFGLCMRFPEIRRILLLVWSTPLPRAFYQIILDMPEDASTFPTITIEDMQESDALFESFCAFAVDQYNSELGTGNVKTTIYSQESASDTTKVNQAASMTLVFHKFAKYHLEQQIQKALTRPFDGVAFKGGNGAAAIPDVLDAIPIVTLPE